jgi:guanine deaminase
MDQLKIFRGQILNPATEDRYTFRMDGAIVVDKSGTIVGVGEFQETKQRHPQAMIVDSSNRLILPGFVDTHVHLPQYGALALYGKELLEWLKTYIYPAEREFTSEAANTLCPLFFRSLLANGVTTAAIYCSVQKESTHVAFEWAEKTGMRAIIGKVMMDQNSPDFLLEQTTDSLEASEEVCRKWHGADNGRLQYAFTPRFAPTCSRGLMKAAADLAGRYGAYIQTHLAETLAELEWVRELFPEARSYTDVYRRANLLGPKTVLAHAVYVSPEERRLLKETGARLSHCPTSNLFLKSGLMPVRELLDEGLHVGLGSDVGGGPTLSPFEVMRSAIYVHTARRFLPGFLGGDISPATAFYMATLGGAKALGLEDKIGSLEHGKQADFIVVNPGRLSPLPRKKETEIAPETLLSRLIFRGDDRIVEQTYVQGNLCHERQVEKGQ